MRDEVNYRDWAKHDANPGSQTSPSMKKGYPIELSVDELMIQARALAGVDIDDSEILEPLHILHRAYGEESQLDAEGARVQTGNLLRLLANRLRMKRDFERHPEIAEQQFGVRCIGLARCCDWCISCVNAPYGYIRRV